MATPQDRRPQHVDFNIDTLEREKKEPFVFSVGGRPITLIDPQELDFQILMAIEVPAQFLRHAMSPEDRDYLRTQKIEGWKFGELIKAYTRHYGLDDLGNAAGSRTL